MAPLAHTSRGPSFQAVWVFVATLGLALALPGRAQEFRAAWADVFHVGMGSATEVNNMVNSLAAGRYNVVIVQVLGYMDSGVASHGAHWKSAILPWSTRVTASFDPLAYLCTQAHAKGIQVHAWLGGSGGGPYRVSNAWPIAGNATLSAHPEWFMVPKTNSEGGAVLPIDGNYVLDMGSPEVQEYLVSIVRELVSKYPIDGINWDDEINGTGYNQGYGFPAYPQSYYARSGLARYRLNTGYSGTPGITDAAYSNYRRRFKNELMARMQAEIQSIKSNPRQPLWHTMAPLAYDSPPSSCNFAVLSPYTYYCDWAGMLQQGWLDAAIPQVYRRVSNQWSSFTAWCNYSYTCWQYNRKIFIGLGAYLNPKADVLTEMAYVYNKGFGGCATYSYGVPCSDGGDWWGYVAANLYTNSVPVPTMPWRNPATATEGIMWGRVKDANTGLYVDDATVSVAGGPTVRTDGNGYYVATLIPATAGGTVHPATASKAGAVSQTIADATVLAGDVVRYDFLLNRVAPLITNQPAALSLVAGQDAVFSVTAGGTPPLAYQWRLNGGNLPGATASAYTRANAQPADAGAYSVVVTNAYGAVTSAPALLSVNVVLTANATAGGSISRSPDQATYAPNSTVTLTATPVYGYSFTGWSGDASGSASSVTVQLTTNKTITANFASTVADLILDNPDAEVSFTGTWQTGTASTDKYGADYCFASTVADGTSNVVYRPNILTPGNYDVYIWYPQGGNRATNAPWQVVYNGGATNVPVNQTLNGGAWQLIAPACPFWKGTSGYVRLSNDSTQPGAVVLADAVRFAFSGTQGVPPSMTASPQSVSTNAGAHVSFQVSASGSPAPALQWRFNGAEIPGASGSTYSRLSVQPADAGSYSVVASNTAGLAASAAAVLTVVRPSIDSIQRLSEQGFQLQIRGGPGNFAIEATPDFTTWTALTNLSAKEVVFPFLDPDLGQSNRFYRVRGLP